VDAKQAAPELGPCLSPGLLSLDIGSNFLGVAGLRLLRLYLLTSLTHLAIRGNKLHSEGIQELAPHLHPGTLPHLDLCNNAMGAG